MGPLRSTAGDIPVLFEDDHLVVLVKPAGVATANAPRGAESLFTLLAAALGPGAFVGVVSRLDAAVSGVVVLAKSRPAAASLAEQFRERSVAKAYAAVVTGRFPCAARRMGRLARCHRAASRRAAVGASSSGCGPDDRGRRAAAGGPRAGPCDPPGG